jgi:hypothetical protein
MTRTEFEDEVRKLSEPPEEFILRALVNLGEDLLENSDPSELSREGSNIYDIMNVSAQETMAREALQIPRADFLKMDPSPLALYLRNR